MIEFERLDKDRQRNLRVFRGARPFPHIVIDDVCDAHALRSIMPALEARLQRDIDSSGDFVFAKNKFVDQNFGQLDKSLEELRKDLLSREFGRLLSDLLGADLFVDPDFYGGGLHAGGAGSFLDMHTDFSFHPQNLNWRRRLNLLLYLNDAWVPDYGGELLLQDLNKQDVEPERVAPLFNRLVIMETCSHTLHGYDPISFPKGSYRLSIAAYAYSFEEKHGQSPRSTTWYPRKAGVLKRVAGKWVPHAVEALRKLRRN